MWHSQLSLLDFIKSCKNISRPTCLYPVHLFSMNIIKIVVKLKPSLTPTNMGCGGYILKHPNHRPPLKTSSRLLQDYSRSTSRALQEGTEYLKRTLGQFQDYFKTSTKSHSVWAQHLNISVNVVKYLTCLNTFELFIYQPKPQYQLQLIQPSFQLLQLPTSNTSTKLSSQPDKNEYKLYK